MQAEGETATLMVGITADDRQTSDSAESPTSNSDLE